MLHVFLKACFSAFALSVALTLMSQLCVCEPVYSPHEIQDFCGVGTTMERNADYQGKAALVWGHGNDGHKVRYMPHCDEGVHA